MNGTTSTPIVSRGATAASLLGGHRHDARAARGLDLKDAATAGSTFVDLEFVAHLERVAASDDDLSPADNQ